MALLGAAWIPMWFFLNLYLQQVLGFGALEGGLALLPMTLTIMVLMVGVTSRVVARLGTKTPLVAGLVVLAVGIGWLSFVGPGSSFVTTVLPGTLVAAAGMSLAYIPAMLTALSGARPEEGGLAAGIVNTTYQVGSALGLAVVTAIATAAGAGAVGDPAALGDSFRVAFVGAAAVALIAAAVAMATVRAPATASAHAPAREPQFAD
jgi:MFS family permease